VEIVCALWDRVVPTGNHRYLHRRLPRSKLDVIDAGHLAWEDAAGVYADLITSWWAGGYADV
jgi:pimeloyl-ACP methyl ester carboxylesterase